MSRKKSKKKLRMSKFEKLLYTIAVFLLLASPISIVFSKATLAKVNFEVEQEKKKIETQEKTNEGLSMTIDELASLTKIQEVAEAQGLSYNNNNIKTITQDSE
ncbi:MAG: cell division protein FtsL [Bacilli bacterium]|nr:cell division protein FtsL [Bacilli bacterium]